MAERPKAKSLLDRLQGLRWPSFGDEGTDLLAGPMYVLSKNASSTPHISCRQHDYSSTNPGTACAGLVSYFMINPIKRRCTKVLPETKR